ncbi:MAG: heme exporter protein CcmD [Francisellaceae bacterium]|nr:heme exporter protein CcmD [Francisellaceae bacterium]MBT6537994.1 heme exporter protein CcmD [Francisellaceae bacterium]
MKYAFYVYSSYAVAVIMLSYSLWNLSKRKSILLKILRQKNASANNN